MYNLPPSTYVNKIVLKKTLISQLGANIRMKEHFTDDVVRVEWLAKLAPSTLNVADGNDVHEISVFLVPLKQKTCPNDIFTFIDGIIPRHTLFVLRWDNKTCLHLNYKQWVEGNTKTEKSFCITKTYRSDWMDDETMSIQIDGLNMDAIYETLVRQVAGERIIVNSSDLREDVDCSIQREALLKEIETLKNKEANEKQPQKKFTLHKKIVELKSKLNGQ